jgi:hypothetical protein
LDGIFDGSSYISRGDTVMALNDVEIRNAVSAEKPFKLAHEKGLYVLINKVGKYFRYDYRFQGQRKTLALGVYPETSLKEAREAHYDAHRLLQNGIDPSLHRKNMKVMEKDRAKHCFEAVAREWFTKNQHTWAESHSRGIIRRLELNVFSWLGSRPLALRLRP